MRNIWIFGATGFIGRALSDLLRTDKNNMLHVLIHKKTPYRYLEDVNTFSGSLADFDPVWFNRYPPDVIFHLARFAGSYDITRRIATRKAFAANERLIRIIKNLPKYPVTVYISGSLMYGHLPEGQMADEHAALNPVSFAKYYIKGEQPWLAEQKLGTLDVRIARPAWIVGTASWFYGFYWKYYQNTGKVPCFGSGEQLMSLIHLEDCARMIDHLSLSGKRGQNLNIFAGNPVTQRQFSKIQADVLNTEVEMIPEKKMLGLFGSTATKAMEASIPLTTDYPELHKRCHIRYPNPEEIIKQALILLENE